jgi:hypothetical protein
MNRLSTATSPYLRQHAANPVDWWPWCPEAFEEARRRDVPVLISVGYSACHWCHVMAHESFEDATVAGALNGGFVPIKVDREERPDVDAVYMEAVQLVNGSGGWPMTVLALPDGRPFWAGTYLRKDTFVRLLGNVADLWGSQRTDIEADAGRLAEAVRQGAELPAPLGRPGERDDGAGEDGAGKDGAGDDLAHAAKAVLARSDPPWGGLGTAPKFPQPGGLDLLCQYWWRTGDQDALDAVRLALDAMSSGGIYDHLAGGFARYSTDRHWLVPHFEKMLYDNALLVRTYTRAWQLTGSPRYRQVVTETVGYLLHPPVRLANGAWASAEDADSEGEEGRFYVWSRAEIERVAGPDVADWYGATPEGNWEGKNILWRPGMADLSRPAHIEKGRRILLEHRNGRSRPGLDDKVLTEWNAMAVSALAYAGRALGQPQWVAAAEATAEVLLAAPRAAGGRWLRSLSADEPGTGALACAGDYAWLVECFTRLAEATGRSRWVAEARAAADALIELFWDPEGGAFFTSGNDSEALIARMKDVYDGAVPSANGTAVLALARLGEITGEQRYAAMARETLAALRPALERSPGAFPVAAVASDYLSRPRRQVVVASTDEHLVQPVWSRYLPDTVLAWGEPFPSSLWDGRDDEAATGCVFVCQGYACRLPVRDGHQVAALLGPDRPSTLRTG